MVRTVVNTKQAASEARQLLLGKKERKETEFIAASGTAKRKKAGDGLAVPMAAKYLHGRALCLILLAKVELGRKGL